MAAKVGDKRIGNKFWELRSKHGRDKLFATPELMWEAACEYFEWIEANPLIEIDYKGKDANRVEMPHIRPFTIHGLCLYLGVNVQYFTDFEQAIKGKDDPISKEFSLVVTRIRETIYDQKFSGAACGFYNASIISQDLGLINKSELNATIQKIGKDLAEETYE
jgi:hypothetical protein